MKELSQIISNESGTLSIRPHKGGIWLVVEDGQDICSIALSQEEIITLWDEARITAVSGAVDVSYDEA